MVQEFCTQCVHTITLSHNVCSVKLPKIVCKISLLGVKCGVKCGQVGCETRCEKFSHLHTMCEKICTPSHFTHCVRVWCEQIVFAHTFSHPHNCRFHTQIAHVCIWDVALIFIFFHYFFFHFSRKKADVIFVLFTNFCYYWPN